MLTPDDLSNRICNQHREQIRFNLYYKDISKELERIECEIRSGTEVIVGSVFNDVLGDIDDKFWND